MKRQRPSGSQQRKVRKAKDLETKAISGSIFKYMTPSTSSTTEENAEQILLAESEDFDKTKEGQVDETQVREIDKEEEERRIKEVKEVQFVEEKEKETDKDEEGRSRDDKEEKLDDDQTNIFAIYSDIASWPIPVPADLRVDLVKRGSEHFQNKDGPFSAAAVERPGDKTKGKIRNLTTSWFYKALPNGEKVLRKWMVYSQLKGSLFCFCCKLFADARTEIQTFSTGFNAWWKLNPKVSEHEASEHHLSCLEKWKTLGVALKLRKTIDCSHQVAIDKEKQKWRDILHRLLDVTLFLAHQNLPFRGHREDLLSENRGNFLELVKLLSKYDPVLKEHVLRIEHAVGNNKRVGSYLSKGIQNEFISVLGNQVKQRILDDLTKAKYFGILFDSTPDEAHIDQMSEVIRYVHIEGDKVEVKESFLGFFPLSGKTAAELTKDILEQLEEDKLDISLCRAQGYDNAATMAGVHGGVQKKIKEINPKALFIPCANHSLNLCGVHSFGISPSSVTFFGTLERVYTFFSASTHRWEILMKNVGVSVKRLAETRWSAHYDAVAPIKRNFEKLLSTLELLCDPSKENVDTRGTASTLIPALCDFTFLCYLAFWCEVLEEVNLTQKYLQTSGLTLDKCLAKFNALKIFLLNERNQIVERAIRFATEKCEFMEISMERRGRRRMRKMMPGEQAKDAGLTLPEEMQRVMLECLDRFYQELEHRSKAMGDIVSIFAVIQPKTLMYASEEELLALAPNLTKTYDEFSDENIVLEIVRLRRHLEAANIPFAEAENWTTLELLRFIVKWDFSESLPNLSLCTRFYLTVCVSVAACERSFSKLKLIKNYLRSTMSQSRLTNLAILSIESQHTKNIDFTNVIENVSAIKARKYV